MPFLITRYALHVSPVALFTRSKQEVDGYISVLADSIMNVIIIVFTPPSRMRFPVHWCVVILSDFRAVEVLRL